jgi:HlyD family secretion protein
MHAPGLPTAFRKSAKWFALALVLAIAVWRIKFAPMPVQMFEVKPGVVVGEVMGTGTLEARIKTTLSPRLPDRLADQDDFVKAGRWVARLEGGELRQQVVVAAAARGGRPDAV